MKDLKQEKLDKINAIITECLSGKECSECRYYDRCSTNIETQALGVCKMIKNIIQEEPDAGLDGDR